MQNEKPLPSLSAFLTQAQNQTQQASSTDPPYDKKKGNAEQTPTVFPVYAYRPLSKPNHAKSKPTFRTTKIGSSESSKQRQQAQSVSGAVEVTCAHIRGE